MLVGHPKLWLETLVICSNSREREQRNGISDVGSVPEGCVNQPMAATHFPTSTHLMEYPIPCCKETL
jgi:hypothetical protein